MSSGLRRAVPPGFNAATWLHQVVGVPARTALALLAYPLVALMARGADGGIIAGEIGLGLLVAAWMVARTGVKLAPAWYLGGAAALTFIGSLLLPTTARH